jgi:hypothetical protein
MASGISTTSRFSGILLGFASLGAVLASNMSTSIRAALEAPPIHQALDAAHIQMQEIFIGRVVAGDLEGAIAMYPAELAHALSGIARDAYAHGFSRAFVLAAVVAVVCAMVVFLTMRVRRRLVEALPGRAA